MEVLFKDYLAAAFLEDEYHIKSQVIRRYILQKLSEKKGMQKLRRNC